MKIQLRNLYLFSTYTGLQLEIPKCEATEALWSLGNPIAPANLLLLKQQLHTINLTGQPGGVGLKLRAPNESYKVLGVQLNPLLNFKDHFVAVTSEVRQISTVLKRTLLSPNRKQLIIQQLLQGKYHAVHLGVFSDTQLQDIDRILNSATRHAQGLPNSFPIEAIHRDSTEFGLNKPSILVRAMQLSASQLTTSMNKPSLRGELFFQHVRNLCQTYATWPRAALEHHTVKMPTLRILLYLDRMGLQLKGISFPSFDTGIAYTIGALSDTVDHARHLRRKNLPQITNPKAYRRYRTQECAPLRASQRINRHLTPAWETTIRTWQDILERDQANILLRPINRLVMQYAPTANTSEKGKLRRVLRTLRHILSSPITREYRKLHEHTTSDSHTDHLPLRVHPSWRDHIPHQDLQHTQSWLQTLFRSPVPRSTKTTHTHCYELHHTATALPEFDVARVTGHRYRGKQLHYRLYRVEWTLEHLTDQQIADQEALGFEIQHRTPTTVPAALQKSLRGRPKCPVCNMQVAPTAEYRLCRSRNCHAATHVGCTADPGWQCAWCMKHHIPLHWLLQEVQWKPSWQLAADVLTADSGESAIHAYKQTRLPPPKHTTPRQAPALPAGWCPRFCAFQLAHMHPDLNILPLGRMVIAAHPTDNDHYTLHSSTGSTVSVLPRRKIQQLYTLFKPHCTQLTFEEEVHALVARSLALRKPRKPRQRETPSLRGTCPLRCSAPPTPYTLTHSGRLTPASSN